MLGNQSNEPWCVMACVLGFNVAFSASANFPDVTKGFQLSLEQSLDSPWSGSPKNVQGRGSPGALLLSGKALSGHFIAVAFLQKEPNQSSVISVDKGCPQNL